MKELENLLFSSRTCIVRQRLKTIIIRPLDRNDYISPVGNIVTKVRMSVVTRPLMCFAFGSATTVAGDFVTRTCCWSGYNTYILNCILPRNITKECIINAKHGLLFVWGEERICLVDDVLSILPAWFRFDTVEYDLLAMENLLRW